MEKLHATSRYFKLVSRPDTEEELGIATYFIYLGLLYEDKATVERAKAKMEWRYVQ